MKKISTNELDALSIGATLLGSGGGGDPTYDLMIAKEAVIQNGPVDLVDLEELPKDALIAPIGFMGAPMVCNEKLPSGNEFVLINELVKQHYGRPIDAVLPFEIGGGNALVPFYAAHYLGVPVVDGDIMGRAFPEIHMNACFANGISPGPAFIADTIGNSATLHCCDGLSVERLLRALTTAMGASSAVAVWLMKGRVAQQNLFHGTISEAIAMGNQVLNSSAKASDLLKNINGEFICSGTIQSIEQQLKGGFLFTTIEIFSGQEKFKILCQNEYLVVQKDREVVVATPDVIAISDIETGYPLPVERLHIGLRVIVGSFPARSLWKTERGLAIAGPEVFDFAKGEIHV